MGRRRWTVVVVGVCVLAACGSSNSSKPDGAARLRVIVSATASQTSRFETTTSSDSIKIVVAGVIDFGNPEGSAVVRQVEDPSTSPTSADPASPCPSSGTGPNEFRWIGTKSYLHSGETCGFGTFPGHRTWETEDYARIAAVQNCAAINPSTAIGQLLGVSGDGIEQPSDVLNQLRTAGATLAQVGSESVRGTTTTHWKVTGLPTTETTTTVPGCARPKAALQTHVESTGTEIWTDSQNRLRRVKTSIATTFTLPAMPGGPAPNKPTTVNQSTTTDLYDFGVTVDVQAPPAAQVYDETNTMLALIRGPGTIAPNAWRAIAHGAIDSKPWTVWYAKSSTGWQCYDPEGAPNFGGSASTFLMPAPESTSVPTHDGHPAQCPTPSFQVGAPLTVLVVGTDGNTRVLVGAVADGVESARLRFPDGSTVPVQIDPSTALVEWSGPAPAPTQFQSDAGNCALTADAGGDTDQCDGNSLSPIGG